MQMTEQTAKLACFYVGFNGDLGGVLMLLWVAVECSVNARTGSEILVELTAFRHSETKK